MCYQILFAECIETENKAFPWKMSILTMGVFCCDNKCLLIHHECKFKWRMLRVTNNMVIRYGVKLTGYVINILQIAIKVVNVIYNLKKTKRHLILFNYTQVVKYIQVFSIFKYNQ